MNIITRSVILRNGAGLHQFRHGKLLVKKSSPFLSKSCASVHHSMFLGSLSTFQPSRLHASNANPKRPKMSSSKLGAISSIAVLSLTKSKSILAALKLTKFASLGSMLVTVGAYTSIYGLPYASGMVGLILVHETGHLLMMRKKGIPYSPMIFVPFMGAAIAAKKPPKNAYDDALIALAGPALGSLGAAGVFGAGILTNSQLCFALADFGFMINLFNLLPVGMLDGGRIGNALSPYVGVAGVGLAGSMIYTGMISNPIIYLITLAGGYQSGMRLWNQHKGIVDTTLPRNFYNISQAQKMKIGGSYFGLMGLLFSAMAVNNEYKRTPEQIRFQQRVNSGMLVDGSIENIHQDY